MQNEENKRQRDEKLLARIQNGEEDALEALIDYYKPLVIVKARAYFLIGADKEDIIQEGMIGLYKAIRNYDSKKSPYFSAFAELCIVRQMMTAIKTASRQKHLPLNQYISFNNTIDYEEKTYIDTLATAGISNPEDIFIGKEEKNYLETQIQDSLSALEKRVLHLFFDGKNYSEIAAVLHKDEKAVDNALQRVRRKVNKILQEKG